MSKGQKKWSLTTHLIIPLACFMAGMLLPVSIALRSLNSCAHADASAQNSQLVECLGSVNDLENLKADAERRLGDTTQELDRVRAELRASEASSASTSAQPIDWNKEVEEEEAWSKKVGKAHGKAPAEELQWSKFGQWEATPLEPIRFSNRFDFGLPIDTIKWSGGQLLLPSKLASGAHKQMETRGDALQHVDSQCTELDVVVLDDEHCVAVTSVNVQRRFLTTPYHLTRFIKRYDAQEGTATWDQVSRLTLKTGRIEGTVPGARAIEVHRRSLARFFQSVDEVEKELKPVLQKAARDNIVITMTMNAGMTDLLLNFICSAKKLNAALDQLVLFPTDDDAVGVAKNLQVAHYRHASFGDFPKEEAANYGDNAFVAMMWIKVLCVYLPVNLGYSVLFQDADIVWLRNPLQEFFAQPKLSGDHDVYFQDDGSRSTRFSPYFANSGFYFLRSNPRTKYFMTMLLYQGDQIIAWRSHQAVLVQTLADASSKFGLKVKVLSYRDFPSGKDYHNRKPYMQAWLKGDEHPYAFHMCWTANKVDKVKYLKQLGEWFMHRTCNASSLATPELLGQGALQDTCCSAEPIVDCFFKDKASAAPGCPNSPNKDKGGRSWW